MEPCKCSLQRLFRVIMYCAMLSGFYLFNVTSVKCLVTEATKTLNKFKYSVYRSLSKMPSVRDLFVLSGGSGYMPILVAELIAFSGVMMYVRRAKERSEKKIDEFLTETLRKLNENQAGLDQEKKSKSTRVECAERRWQAGVMRSQTIDEDTSEVSDDTEGLLKNYGPYDDLDLQPFGRTRVEKYH